LTWGVHGEDWMKGGKARGYAGEGRGLDGEPAPWQNFSALLENQRWHWILVPSCEAVLPAVIRRWGVVEASETPSCEEET